MRVFRSKMIPHIIFLGMANVALGNFFGMGFFCPTIPGGNFPSPELLFPGESSRNSTETSSKLTSFLSKLAAGFSTPGNSSSSKRKPGGRHGRAVPFAVPVATVVRTVSVLGTVSSAVRSLKTLLNNYDYAVHVKDALLTEVVSEINAELSTVQEKVNKLVENYSRRTRDETDLRIALDRCSYILHRFTKGQGLLTRGENALLVSPIFMRFVAVYGGLLSIARGIWEDEQEKYGEKMISLLQKLGDLRDSGIAYRMGLVFSYFQVSPLCTTGCCDNYKMILPTCYSCAEVTCGWKFPLGSHQTYICHLLSLYQSYYEGPYIALRKQLLDLRVHGLILNEVPNLSRLPKQFAPITHYSFAMGVKPITTSVC